MTQEGREALSGCGELCTLASGFKFYSKDHEGKALKQSSNTVPRFAHSQRSVLLLGRGKNLAQHSPGFEPAYVGIGSHREKLPVTVYGTKKHLNVFLLPFILLGPQHESPWGGLHTMWDVWMPANAWVSVQTAQGNKILESCDSGIQANSPRWFLCFSEKSYQDGSES